MSEKLKVLSEELLKASEIIETADLTADTRWYREKETMANALFRIADDLKRDREPDVDVNEAAQIQDSGKSWEHDGNLAYIAEYVVRCTRAWEPAARLIGNARAGDIACAVGALIDERDRLKALLAISRLFVGANADTERNTRVYDDEGKRHHAFVVLSQIDEALGFKNKEET